MRFGEPDRTDDLNLTVGESRLLASWDDPEAEDVHQLLYQGRPIRWTAPLPGGPWGRAGHIAAAHRDAKDAVVLTDPASGARTHRSVGQALDVLNRAHLGRLRAQRAMPDVPRGQQSAVGTVIVSGSPVRYTAVRSRSRDRRSCAVGWRR
ncbi:hypothetical protein C7C46_31000 [Streptomyces tateyamensis]|uniref:Uncharacterized protein n=1 Tax=Streptomyces tateyamensis TaxID=565073 RepID=A0A2V4N0E1_9ACTN|nr:hypothetical protein [Streptomyces tateyamensis]PYC66747.1 hypothetical protein C7C46_31000 [Streptomyces tateyamensis]